LHSVGRCYHKANKNRYVHSQLYVLYVLHVNCSRRDMMMMGRGSLKTNLHFGAQLIVLATWYGFLQLDFGGLALESFLKVSLHTDSLVAE